MARYQYIDAQGREQTVEAASQQEALSRANNIAPNSGVMLLPDTDTINLGQIDTTAVPLPNVALQTPTPPPVPTPVPLNVPPTTPETEEERLLRRRNELQTEISTLENNITTSSQRRDTALTEAGVFDDMRRLSNLRAEQRRIEDRAVEIPIEARQDLRGRLATQREFQQRTTPRLEDNALEALASSRQVSALTDLVNTNIAIIDSRINAEKEADRFIYEARLNQLNTIESAYSTLLSERQKAALEEAKAIAAINKEASDREWEIVKAQAQLATERGDYETASAILSSGSAADAYALNGRAQQTQRADEALSIIEQVDRLLTMPGISGAVGATWLGRGLLGTKARDIGKEADFIAEFNNFASKATQDALAQAKAKGMALGVLSDRDIQLFEQGALAAGTRDEQGRIRMSEDAFREMLNGVKEANMKVYIASQIGTARAKKANLRDASMDVIQNLYNDLRSSQSVPSQGGYADQDFGVVSSFIQSQEGFSPTAYRDAGGWSVGFGNQTINGRPVQPGDTITPAEAQNLLAQAIQQHSTWTTLVNRALSPLQKTALASFEYNLGSGIWNQARDVIAAVNNGDFARAGDLMKAYNKSLNPATGQREVNPALVARRNKEASLLLA